MFYIILNKTDHHVIHDDLLDAEQVEPKMVYADFDPASMIMIHTDLHIDYIGPYYDNIDGHFTIGKDGKLKEKNLTAKAKAGAVNFDPQLLRNSEDIQKSTGKTQAIRIINLALKLQLFTSVNACEQAFTLLDQEQRIADQYHPARELKITKACMDWLAAGKPEQVEQDKPPQQQYQAMQATITPIKADYTALRAQLKTLLAPLKQAEAKAQAKQTTEAAG